MANQPRVEPLEATTLFEDGQAARVPPEGTVPFGVRENRVLYTGRAADGSLVEEPPLDVGEDLLVRGRERFDIFCSPCHDRAGTGTGMVVERGFRPLPPSLHLARLREAPVGYFFDVMTHGFGAMSDYASQIPPRDRWAIAAYIRVLQWSQAAPLGVVPPDVRDELEAGRP
jgi:mono/diheme cytochrome c family protein